MENSRTELKSQLPTPYPMKSSFRAFSDKNLMLDSVIKPTATCLSLNCGGEII